ncbi:MAG: peptidoglycan D,D-transpeptidase FtsI family protein [bacterium]
MSKRRIYVLFSLLCLGSIVLIGRLVQLQVIDHVELNAMDLVRERIHVDTDPQRGGIYDRCGREMALSVQAPSAYLITKKSDSPDAVLKALARLPWADKQRIREAYRSDKGFVWVHRRLNPDQKQSLDGLSLPEIEYIMETERYYPNAELGAQVVGFVGIDGKGLEGLEFHYDDSLNRTKRPCITECAGDVSSCSRKEHNLYLTIDLAVQFFADDALRRACTEANAQHGLVIIMDTHTGGIIAMANWPGYNPNHFVDYPNDYWRNRCVTDVYEPGSIFKLFWAAALLEEGLVRDHSIVFCENGAITIAGKKIRDHMKFGWLSFRQVIERSSNIGAIKYARELGEKRYYRYIRKFGFGEKTGIDFPGEAMGILRPPSSWSGLSMASISIGQEVSVTPIQMITAFASLVNGGNLMEPFLLKEIRASDGSVLFNRTPTAKKRVISARTSEQLKKILQGVVERGTGQKAAVPGYSIGGKTGTAQMVDPATGEYSHQDFVASFVGFFPDQQARWAMLVMISQPRGTCWGGDVAAPVFGEVAARIIRYYHIPPGDNDRPGKDRQLIVAAQF